MLADTLTGAPFNFENTVTVPDVWHHRAKRPNSTEYYELLLVYIDDILLISHDPKPTLEALGTVYTLKEGSPTRYLSGCPALSTQTPRWPQGMGDGQQ